MPPCSRLACTIEIHGAGDLLPHGFDRHFEAGHHDHRFQTGHGVARRIGVHRRHRTFVAGVHGLQHVERFRTAAFADDDPFGTHTQGISHQVGGGDLPLAFDIRRASFQPHDVFLLQLQFRRVFDRDDAVVVGDEARQRVEQRRFTANQYRREMIMFSRALIAPSSSITISGVKALKFSKSSSLSGLLPKRRMETAAPSKASGGMIAFTREPSVRRASTIGQTSSTRRPTFDTMRSMICIKCALSRNSTVDFSILPRRSTIDVFGTVDHEYR